MGVGSESPKRLILDLVLAAKLPQLNVVPALFVEPVLENARLDTYFGVKLNKILEVVAVGQTQVVHLPLFHQLLEN